MFIIVNGNRTVLGPMEWKPVYFSRFLSDEYGLTVILPRENSERTFFKINDSIKILPVKADVDPSYDSRTQYLTAPQFRVYAESADSYRTVENKTFNQIKSEIMSQVPSMRWQKENSGLKIKVNTKTIFVDTSREKRNIFSSGIAGSWKLVVVNESVQDLSPTQDLTLSSEWVDLSDKDIIKINDEIKKHIQSAFDWEKTTTELVQSKTSIEDLLSLNL